jgi:hypothetical protein
MQLGPIHAAGFSAAPRRRLARRLLDLLPAWPCRRRLSTYGRMGRATLLRSPLVMWPSKSESSIWRHRGLWMRSSAWYPRRLGHSLVTASSSARGRGDVLGVAMVTKGRQPIGPSGRATSGERIARAHHGRRPALSRRQACDASTVGRDASHWGKDDMGHDGQNPASWRCAWLGRRTAAQKSATRPCKTTRVAGETT